jgi:hypothetical protein
MIVIAAAEPVVVLVAKPLGAPPGVVALPFVAGVVSAPVRALEYLARRDEDRGLQVNRRGLPIPIPIPIPIPMPMPIPIHGLRLHGDRSFLDPGRAALQADRKVDLGAGFGDGASAEGCDGEGGRDEELGGEVEAHDGSWSCDGAILLAAS